MLEPVSSRALQQNGWITLFKMLTCAVTNKSCCNGSEGSEVNESVFCGSVPSKVVWWRHCFPCRLGLDDIVDPDAAVRDNRDSRFGDVRGDVRGDVDARLERCDERGVGELGEDRPLDDRSLDDRPLDVRLTRVRDLLWPWSWCRYVWCRCLQMRHDPAERWVRACLLPKQLVQSDALLAISLGILWATSLWRHHNSIIRVILGSSDTPTYYV